MRPLKFRGKRIDGHGWEIGCLVYSDDGKNALIVAWDGYPQDVHPATVGQFTGLQDKNGVDIFEGSVLAWDGEEDDEYHMVVVWGKFGWAYSFVRDKDKRKYQLTNERLNDNVLVMDHDTPSEKGE